MKKVDPNPKAKRAPGKPKAAANAKVEPAETAGDLDAEEDDAEEEEPQPPKKKRRSKK